MTGRRIEIRGTVQGVGFRPWVYRIARELGVAGRVHNHARGVTVEAFADDGIPLSLTNHKFTPSTIHVKAGVPNVITLTNNDDTAEEFDSHSLNREKHVPPKSQATIFIGPLAPGRYIYEGESEIAGGAALGVIVVE